MGHHKLGLWLGMAPSALLVQGVLALPALAQVCTSDDACPTGTRCEFSPTDPGACGGDEDCVTSEPAPAIACAPDAEDCKPSGEPVPTSGECVPLSEGQCEFDADCDPRLECVKYQVDVACAPNEDCFAEASESRYGDCALPITACQTDTDCLTGLTCVDSNDGSVSGGGSEPSAGSGGATDAAGASTTKAAEKYCDYRPKSCTADDECGANYECVESGSGQSCAISAPACLDGEECPEPETTCTEIEVEKACAPKELPCATDAECPSGFLCFEFSQNGEEVPDAWNVTGSSNSCLPEGIALLILSEGARDISLGDSKGDGDEAPVAGGDASEERGDVEPQLPEVTDGDGSMCALSPARPGAAWLAAFVGLLGLVFVRRRARS
jgi:hypothetical protein